MSTANTMIHIVGRAELDGQEISYTSARYSSWCHMRPALIIVDMQKDFLIPSGSCYNEQFTHVIPKVRRILDVFRDRKLPVVHVITVHRRDYSDVETLEFQGPLSKSARYNAAGIEGSLGAEIVDELKPVDRETVVVKKRYSGFYNTDLDMILRRKGVDTIFAAGITSDCCVRFTCADAYFRDYNVVMVKDCVNADNQDDHEYALRSVEKLLGSTKTMDEIAVMLDREDLR